MKPLFPLFLALCSPMMAWAESEPLQKNAEGFYEVNSAEQLQKAVKSELNGSASLAKIKLMADVYLSDVPSGTFVSTFSGILDGDGHTIWAARPEVEHDGGGHYTRGYVFTHSADATYKNLTYRNCRQQSSDWDRQAIVTQDATNCTFQNITFRNVSVWSDKEKVGIVAGTAENCTFEDIYVYDSDATTDSWIAGGIVGQATNSSFTRCVVDDNTCICSDGRNVEGYAGGMVGKCTGGSFSYCVNSAFVVSDGYYVGGIVGYMVGEGKANSSIEGCLNTGMIISLKQSKVPDFFERYKTKALHFDLKSYHDQKYAVRTLTEDQRSEASSYWYLGGIAGAVSAVKVSRCTNFGSVYGSDSSQECRRGGIVGEASGIELSSCLSAFDGGDSQWIRSMVGVFTGAESTFSGNLSANNYPIFLIERLSTGQYASVKYGKVTYTLEKGHDDNYGSLKSVDWGWISGGGVAALLGGWEQNLGTEPLPLPTGNKGVYRTFTPTETYGTLCVTFPLYSNDQISFYMLSEVTKEDDGQIKLHFQYAPSNYYVEAGEPVLYRVNTPGEEITLKRGVEVLEPRTNYQREWRFNSSFTPLCFKGDEAKKVYYIADGAIHNSAVVDITPFEGYFVGPSIEDLTAQAGAAPHISIVIDGEEGEVFAFEEGNYKPNVVYDVANIEEFQEAVKHNLSSDGVTSYSNIRLIADLYLSDLSERTFNNTYSGTLDGNGHTIWAARPEVAHDGTGRFKRSYLFTNLSGATIKNLRMKDMRVSSGDFGNIAAIAQIATNSTFRNLDMDNISIWSDEANVGTVAGQAENCAFDSIRIAGCDVSTDSQVCGGLVGLAHSCTFRHCTVDDQTTLFSDGTASIRSAYVGGIAGYIRDGSVSYCLNQGIIGADSGCAGGIVGSMYSKEQTIKLENCVNAGMVIAIDQDDCYKVFDKYKAKTLPSQTVTYGDNTFTIQSLDKESLNLLSTASHVGGIAGESAYSEICYCFNFGSCYAKIPFLQDSDVAGIAGYSKCDYLYNCACVSGSSYEGNMKGIAGTVEGCRACYDCLSLINAPMFLDFTYISSQRKMGNNYRLAGSNSEATSYEMSVSADMLASGLVAYWLGNDARTRGVSSPWRQNFGPDGDAYPVLDESRDEVTIAGMPGVTVITSADQLRAFATTVNGGNQYACAVLGADINLENDKWIPIGTDEPSKHFRGLFDGQGHTISGLKCESDKAVGLFGAVHDGAVIRNVIIGEDCEFTGTGNSGAGAIVGEVPIGWKWGNVVIENCGNYGKITAKNTVNAGGILGLVRNNTVDAVKVFVNNCFHMGTVTAENGNSALLCGYMRNSGVVTNCWSGSKLLSSTSKKPYDDTQGRPEYFVGYMDNLTLTDCFALDPAISVQGADSQTKQEGVTSFTSEAMNSGELAYKLNGGVVDGTQMWYQTIGTDLYPVRTKLTDGSNMVFSYDINEGQGYANTTSEQIAGVITGIESLSDHPVTDIDESGQVAVSDLVRFIAAALR